MAAVNCGKRIGQYGICRFTFSRSSVLIHPVHVCVGYTIDSGIFYAENRSLLLWQWWKTGWIQPGGPLTKYSFNFILTWLVVCGRRRLTGVLELYWTTFGFSNAQCSAPKSSGLIENVHYLEHNASLGRLGFRAKSGTARWMFDFTGTLCWLIYHCANRQSCTSAVYYRDLQRWAVFDLDYEGRSTGEYNALNYGRRGSVLGSLEIVDW